MGRFTKVLFVAACALGSRAVLYGQDVQPPPKPDENGPTLEFTMKYIQDRLNSEIGWREDAHTNAGDRHYAMNYIISGAEADPKSCTLAFRWAYNIQFVDNAGSPPAATESDVNLSMRDVAKLVVELRSDRDKRRNFYAEYTPPVHDVTIKMVPGKTAHVRSWIRDARGTTERDRESVEVQATFIDGDLSNRLAKALVHAVELCGGGDRDPFK